MVEIFARPVHPECLRRSRDSQQEHHLCADALRTLCPAVSDQAAVLWDKVLASHPLACATALVARRETWFTPATAGDRHDSRHTAVRILDRDRTHRRRDDRGGHFHAAV